jgi:DNA-binding CsgD family transcriptional regulator
VVEGRERCIEAAATVIDSVGHGAGATVAFTGPPGSGRTTMTVISAGIAARGGFRVGRSGVSYGPSVPYGAMLAALTSGPIPLVDLDDLALGSDASVVPEIAAHLRRLAADGPIVIVIDDVDRVDPQSASAVQQLAPMLVDVPVLWLLAALRPGNPLPSGCRTIELEPLDDDSVQRLAVAYGIADALDPIRLSRLTNRQPRQLTTLFRGLLDELPAAAAAPSAGFVPVRLRHDLANRLLALPEDAQRLLALLASLSGTRFTVGVAATALGRPVESVHRQAQGLIADGLLVPDGDYLLFPHEFVREAARDELPPVLLRSLQQRLLTQPDLYDHEDPHATELLAVAEAGDVDTVRLLDQAATELSETHPAESAQIFRRAVELAPPAWSQRSALVRRAVFALSRSGDLSGARLVAEREQTRSGLDANDAAILHLQLSEVTGQQSFTQAVWHADAGLAAGPTSRSTEATLRAHRLVNLGLAGRPEKSLAELPLALALLDQGIDDTAASAVLLAASYVRTLVCDWSGALVMADRAEVLARRLDDKHQHWVAGTWRPLLLSRVGAVDAALAEIDRGASEALRRSDVTFGRQLRLSRSKVLLDAGRLVDALAAADAALAEAEGAQMDNLAAASAGVTFCRAALAIGDPEHVRRATERIRSMTRDDSVLLRSMGWWIESITADGIGQPERAAQLLAEAIAPYVFAGLEIAEMQFTEPADAPTMLRIARRGGRPDIATRVLDLAETRAKINHEIPLFVAVALHCRGLYDEDIDTVGRAIDVLRPVRRPLPLANALEDVAELESSPARGIAALDEALALTVEAGAERQAARIRRHLRDLGVRRPRAIVRPEADSHGTDGRLTRAQQDVVRLVVDGATNREVAAALSLSPHTVSTHLRHAFTKLGVTSRAELAVALREQTETGGDTATS